MNQTLLGPSKQAPSSAEWDTELLVLRADDRAGLIARCRELLPVADGHASLKDLAFTLNADLPDGGTRLAVVAKSPEDFAKKLARAADRLADPSCERIRDSAGVYYSAEPLYPAGKVAFLFPGEGAQYLNMLGDLPPHFPEVAEFFAYCDRITAETGHADRAVSRFMFLPPDASEADKQESERLLRQLDNAMYSVLAANGGIFRLLQALGVPFEAAAGHSMGELAALYAAEAVEADSQLFDRTVKVFGQLQEDDAAGGFVLLAVGAGKGQLDPIIAGLDEGGHVHIAMDNCPHQAIVVGPEAPMHRVEVAIRERKLMCERLPFARPYHTPMFAPALGPLGGMFDEIAFQKSVVPVYSCTTARPFPPEPAAIRELTVAHWAAPVRFTEMIRNMYDDGVRIFVESGPRGNLTTFAEDILRGKPALAVAADVQRRGGPTQVNHMAGMLAAHGVPLRLRHLYERRSPRTVRSGIREDSDRGRAEPNTHESGYESRSSAPVGTVRHANGRARIMSRYLGVMDQFLDMQNRMMRTYLAGRSAPRRQSKPVVKPAKRPMVGDIVRHVPGQEIVMRRPMDTREDHFVTHHTIGGRGASKVDPDQNGLPVLPMTFTLETMAELAETLLPGKKAVGFRRVKLMRWLPYNAEEPTSIEAVAALGDKPGPHGELTVSVEIRDLGNASRPATSKWVAAQATVLLADRYPEPPDAGEFPLADEHPCRTPRDVMYKNLFHGSLFEGITGLGRSGEDGIVADLEILPREELYASTKEPALSTDPVMLDVGMHPLAAWHLEQPDQSGRILLPVELKSLDLYGPPPPVGAKLTCRGRLQDSSARHFTHSVDYLTQDGRLWGRMQGMRYWRFYVPFGEVNFHGPKDEYFLSREWDLPFSPTVPSGQNGGHPPDVCVMRLVLKPDLLQVAIRTAAACVSLTPGELKVYRELELPEKQINEWLYRRIIAKDVVRTFWYWRHGERMFPADVAIELDEFGRGLARRRGEQNPPPFARSAVVYLDEAAVGVASFGDHLGLAVEKGGAEAVGRCAAEAVRQALGLDRPPAVLDESKPLVRVETPGGPVTVDVTIDHGYVVAVTRCEKG